MEEEEVEERCFGSALQSLGPLPLALPRTPSEGFAGRATEVPWAFTRSTTCPTSRYTPGSATAQSVSPFTLPSTDLPLSNFAAGGMSEMWLTTLSCPLPDSPSLES